MMERCSFSGGGECLAVGQLDGEVKIWDALAGALKQRFAPGAAGNGVIRCLSWSSSERARVSTWSRPQTEAVWRQGVVRPPKLSPGVISGGYLVEVHT